MSATAKTATPHATADWSDLERALRRRVDGEIGFDPGDRAMYAIDASHYRQVPIGVVAPRHTEDILETVAVAREHEAPILMRGAGTSLAGQGCNAAVAIDTSRHLNRILEIDPDRRIARVQPGVVLDDLRAAAAEHGLTFGPDPSTHAVCTVGGMIGNNACGVHSMMAGRTSDNVERLDVLTYDGHRLDVGPTSDDTLDRLVGAGGRVGEIYGGLRRLRDEHAEEIRRRYPDIPRRVSGYNLDELLPERGFHAARALVGTEGTCVTVLEATLRLVPDPPVRTLVVLGYPDIAAAGDDVPALREHRPVGLEGMDDFLVENMRAKGVEAEGLKVLPEGRGWLFVEHGGWSREEADAAAEQLVASVRSRDGSAPTSTILREPRAQRAIWAAREAGLGSSARLADGTDTWEGWEDAAVHPDRLGDYLRGLRGLLEKYGYRGTFYGHFGQGLVHNRTTFDLATEKGVRTYRAFVEEAADLVVRLGGSLSGEHGDGQSRAELLSRMYGSSLVDAFRRFKGLWDPTGQMNPGKVVDPRRLDEDIWSGPATRGPSTRFQYPDDDRSFARAAGRCIGAAKCRRMSGGTMCPSYMATQEEKHTTRGRARLLTQMIDGELPGGWRNESVKEALDLCLACKGCKRECPAGVDMATYKAEFLSHYYEGRWRPRHAYAFGLIPWVARVVAWAPSVANFLTQTPGLSGLAKAAAGMAPSRQIPPFASEPFQRWAAKRRGPVENRPRVVLWPDTFHNYFRPEAAKAAVSVLESAGYRVVVPPEPLCCGRPLYDYGMLDRAEQTLERTLAVLDPVLSDGTPMVALEPSCAAVFRDELRNLFPDDPRARRLREATHTLAELLQRCGYEPPARSGHAILHGHCHHKAIMGLDPDAALLSRTGLEVETPETGCCGMAGSFGFEKAHYNISVRIGERALLPAARQASSETRLVTDGFSCREQIAQQTNRHTFHLAEVLAEDGPSEAPTAAGE